MLARGGGLGFCLLANCANLNFISLQRQSLDEELPQFDPNNFKPGYVPPTVKKGDEEYAIIVSGVKDTGLCGKYWSDMDHLPRRRKYVV